MQAAPVRPAKPKPQVIGTETVKCLCGHEATFELFADRQDKFRDGRRAKLTGRPCPTCRMEANNKRQAEEAAAAKAQKPNPTQRKDRKIGSLDKQSGRLPDGAEFHLKFDALPEPMWTGVLEIGEVRLASRRSGVFGLLRELDRQWRAKEKELSPDKE